MDKYGCNNKPAQSLDATYVAQDGWHKGYSPAHAATVRVPVWVEIKAAFGTIGCNYDKPTTDPKCVGCWQAKAAA